MSFLYRLLAVLVLLTSLAAHPVFADEGSSAHIKANLIAQSLSVPKNGDVLIGLDYTPTPGWHTYWVNPGDTGLAPVFHWNLPDHVTAGAVEWPAPVPLPTQGLMSYGYDGRTVLLMKLHNGTHLSNGSDLPLHAKVDFLVCADVCVPESLNVSLTLKVGPPSPSPDDGVIAHALKTLPQAAPITATITQTGEAVDLGFTLPASDKGLQAELAQPDGVFFFPEQADMLSAPAPQVLDMGPEGLTLHTKAGGDALPDGDLSGVLKFSDGAAYAVKLTRAPLAAGVHGLGAAPATKSGGGVVVFLIAIGSAFLGGIILNLMPCVFPVLAMKLFSLSRAGHDQALARKESLVYGGGAILSFIALALVLVLAHALGQSLGWGFQLQSPYVTAVLALVMLLVALNMGGFFEIGAWLQKMAGNVQIDTDRPMLAAFMTGVLAVVVAAPCTAPFMAPAIGFALTQGAVTSFAVFLALGVGFALPFVGLTWLITLVPQVAKLLPRPGDWMISLRRFLSVLMFLAAFWLVWVFAQQVNRDGIVFIVFALAAVTAGVIDRLKLEKNVKPILVVVGLALTVLAASQPPAPKPSTPEVAAKGKLPRTDFDPEKLAALRAQGKPVLVDMTAAWCVTCKVNELGALSDRAVVKAMQDSGTVYMVGDWTNQNAAISHYLGLYGRSGVPLYVYYGPGNAQPVVLPQLLQAGDLVKRIKGGA